MISAYFSPEVRLARPEWPQLLPRLTPRVSVSFSDANPVVRV